MVTTNTTNALGNKMQATTQTHEIWGLRWTTAQHDRGWDAIATLQVRNFPQVCATAVGCTEMEALDALRDKLCLEYGFRIDSSVGNEIGDTLQFVR